MSRSYKKNPWCGDNKGKDKKRIVNHKVRQKLKNNLELIVQHNDYKKLYESWEICDYGWTMTFKDFMKNKWEFYHYRKFIFPDSPKPDEKSCYKYWLTHYHNK